MNSRRWASTVALLTAVLVAGIALAGSVMVQPGDTLWRIAQAHNTSVEALMELNGLTSTSIRIGQILEVPGETPPLIHLVEEGDTVWDLAIRYTLSVEAIASYNNLQGYRLRPGQELLLAPPPTSAFSLPTGNVPGPSPDWTGARRYPIQPGDSLYDIARLHDTTVEAIIIWNDLPGTIINPGQILILPPISPDRLPRTRPLVVTVMPGDNLYRIANAHGVSVEALAQTNNLKIDGPLYAGIELVIPGSSVSFVPTASFGPELTLGPRIPSVVEVQVRPGDNLWGISRAYGTTVSAVRALNNLQGDTLLVGQVLKVEPGAGLDVVAGAAAPSLNPQARDAMVWPLVGAITSQFGWRRLVVNGSNMHNGVDIGGRTGDPIRAATAGTVVAAGWRAGYGYTVIIADGDTEYWYAHASALLVTGGEVVRAGDVIARVGATGIATGPHLHFEIRVNGRPIDPLPILEARAVR
jgi:murein DD-endopeptidase MepM/ murein hydrolase activator NlpD